MKKINILLLFLVAIFFSSCTQKNTHIVHLSVWVNEQDNKMIQEMVNNFIKLHKNEVDFEIIISNESESTCKDTVLISPKTAADVFCFADDQFVPLVEANALSKIIEDSERIISENGGKDSLAILASSYGGDLYCYPAVSSSGYFLYYNSNFFTEDEVSSMESLLSKADQHRRKFVMDLTDGRYIYSFFKAAGLDVYMNPDGVTNTCTWNSKEGPFTGVDVVNSILELVKHDSFVSMSGDELERELKSTGNILACISGAWNEKIIRNVMGNGYAATKLPTFNVNGTDLQMHSSVGFKMFGVNPYSRELKWAHRLASYLTNRDNQLVRFWKKSEIPTNITVSGIDKIMNSVSAKAYNQQAEFGHQQIVAENYWINAYRFGNILASGNIENINIQYLLDEMVESCLND